MAAYIILSKISPEAFKDPKDFKKLAEVVSSRIKSDCPKVVWKESFATTGRFDIVDIVESELFLSSLPDNCYISYKIDIGPEV